MKKSPQHYVEIANAMKLNNVYCVKSGILGAIVWSSKRADLPHGTRIVAIEGVAIRDYTSEALHQAQCTTIISSYSVRPVSNGVGAPQVALLPSAQTSGTTRRTRFRTVSQTWDFDNPCRHCGGLYLESYSNRTACCQKGAYAYRYPESVFPKPGPLPPTLLDLLTQYTIHISKLSNRYNSLFCIGATSISSKSGKFEQRFGTHCVTMNGRMFHFIPSAVSNSTRNAISYIVFGGDEVQLTNGIPKEVKGEMMDLFINQLFQMYKDIDNPYTSDLRQIGRLIVSSASSAATPAATVINAKTSCFHVGAITSDTTSGALKVSFTLKGNQKIIDGSSSEIEPLLYPLFFPWGERGWGADLRAHNIHLLQYLRSRILMADVNPMIITDQDRFPFLMQENSAGNRSIPTNRYQLAARLMQYYVVDNVSRMIDRRLDWQKKNQNYINGSSHAHLNASAREVEELSDAESDVSESSDHDSIDGESMDAEDAEEKVYLSESITGSARHRHKLAMNALEIVNQRGQPTVFITCTCNPHWPEIECRLFPGQTAFDRADVTCMVFHQRLEALLYNLKHGKYFGGKRTTYDIRVIEYQHRGLPHAHIVVQLEDSPSTTEASIDWIDNFISTSSLSDLNADSSPDLLALQQLVTSQMTHTCSTAVNGCKNDQGFCRRGYSNTELRPSTTIDDKGYPVYKRVCANDLKIVPYHSGLLLDWQGHCNVEFCGTSYAILYLYKYLYKGNKKVEGKVVENTKDEMAAYLSGRMLCSMDAMWRIYGFQNYPRPSPSVKVIKVKNIGIAEAILEKHKLCDIYVYFNRPPDMEAMSFLEFFQNYTYSKKKPTFTAAYWTGRVEGIKFYIIGRKNSNCIVRLQSVNFHSGDRWFMRLLLLKTHSRSHLDMKRFNDVQYDTYQEAAIAKGIVEEHNEAILAFEESISISTPNQLRTLFVMMTLAQHPTIRIWNNPIFVEAMSIDYFVTFGRNKLTATNMLLQDIKKRLKRENKKMTDYGLPDVHIEESTEIDIYKKRYNIEQQTELLNHLNATTPNNSEQQQLFEEIVTCLQARKRSLIFLQGQGGSGKSTFAKKVLAYARSMGLIALGCAATGLAAQVYGNGEFCTAHHLFGIPVLENEDDYDQEKDSLKSSILESSESFELLQSASLIVWDEFLSNHNNCLDLAFHLTKGFANKVLLCMGDCKQIAPVVKKREPAYTISASMINSYHFRTHFKVVTFTKNMRLLALQENSATMSAQQIEDHSRELAFAQSLLDIGNGRPGEHTPLQATTEVDDPALAPYVSRIRLPLISSELTIESATNFVFPHGINTPNLHKCAILAATNEQVDSWNDHIQSLNPGTPSHRLSTDELADIDDHHGILRMLLTEKVLNRYDVPGIPAHELVLKPGDICLVMRTLRGTDVPLSTNTRVKVIAIKERCIQVMTLTDISYSVNIPRITFKFRLPNLNSYYMHRKQYPLKLAYAMTINKSQGQEFDRAVLDLSRPPFTHGLLYVGISRVRHSQNIRIFNSNPVENDAVTNIVFRDLLDPFQ